MPIVGPLSAGSALRCAAGVLAGELRRVRSALRRYPGAQAYPRYARGECAGTRARVMPACLLQQPARGIPACLFASPPPTDDEACAHMRSVHARASGENWRGRAFWPRTHWPKG